MKIVAAALLGVLLGLGLTVAQAMDTGPAFADPAQQARYESLIRELRCLVCQNQTIADSNAPLASDLRREVRDMMTQGQSDQQIRDFVVARYGDFVLYRPPLTARTYALWLAPVALLLLAAFVVVRIVRQKAAAARANPAALDLDPEQP